MYSSDDKVISNLFSTLFKTIYSTDIFNEFEKYPYSLQNFDFPITVIDKMSVPCSLKVLKLSSSPGPDNLPSYILKTVPIVNFFFYLFFLTMH